ncbi:ribosomal protein S18-alanine N-acetyltransferase [Pseudanabaena sp. FACHB-2040]|uniref:ribosomal protein S18-alanine N-acetyltransferase n=1 Tax=Pseudanabaena sp. FACHB-2040 TaxID=2692859 RepID=UPI001686D886|nr:ribosomal protein S18-alanine N-acetyltransferase [Pseudanabaena sp. FACHB-2040]MBD2260763.1 ribosomal protein S18-alanine N-acetyltransferase [Pseudanabaena sp. FACHB-2040]
MVLAGALFCHSPSIEDLPAIVSLDQRCLGGLWSENGYRREMDSPNSLFRVLSTVDPAPSPGPSTPSIIGIGCLWAILDEAHITILGIDPLYQGQGLGQWLLLHLLQAAHHQQLQHATLEVRASNTPAQKLYQKFGFQQVGCRRRYYSDGEDALLLWRSGLQNTDFLQQLIQWQAPIVIRLRHQGWHVDDEICNDGNCSENRMIKNLNSFDKN